VRRCRGEPRAAGGARCGARSDRKAERERTTEWPSGRGRSGLCPRSPLPGRSVPAVFWRAGPCRPVGDTGSPGTTWLIGPGRPGHDSCRVVPCLGRAKKSGLVPGCRALGCIFIYSIYPLLSLGIVRPRQKERTSYELLIDSSQNCFSFN
jgi:hypothetical protein